VCGHKAKHWSQEKDRYEEHICANCWFNYSDVPFHQEIECGRSGKRVPRIYNGNEAGSEFSTVDLVVKYDITYTT